MEMRKAMWFAAGCAIALMPRAATAQAGKFDGNWMTHMSCEAHGQMPAYKWDFPSTITGGAFHGQHGEQGGPGYLVIDGKIPEDGNAKLKAKGTVTQSQAHGVFAMKGNNYDYEIKATFTEAKGTGTRDAGVGILGRPCTFEFDKQTETPATPAAAPPAAN